MTSQPNLEGAVEPPRRNGELVFEAPWEARAFGMAMVLHQHNVYPWREFSARLAAEIAEDGGERVPGALGAGCDAVLPARADTESRYYGRWLAALEGLVVERGMVTAEEIDARTEAFAAGLWDDHHE